MNSTVSNASSLPLGFPIGLVPLPLVQEEVKWLVLITTYTAFLVPIAAVLFFFSTPQLRGRPVFILNVNTVFLNLQATPRTAIASICLFICVPFFVQGILILRVRAVYPLNTLSRTRLVAIYGPIALFKLARIANMAYLIFRFRQAINDAGGLSTNTIFTVSQAVWTFPSTKAEWFLQLFDDMYVSTLFIARLRKPAGVQGKSARPTSQYQGTYIQRLKTLFWTAVFNFVFPIIFNIALIILLFHEPDFLHGSYIIYTNNYAQIIGVLLATVFVAGRQDESKDESPVDDLRQNRSEGSTYATRIALQNLGSNKSHLQPVDITKVERGI
ncbi:hypothetical protein GSI_12172 [Ganoderma sinense ZZ0214-1]|uniref:Uncharacterized protein n=1 Tax=Ganoderma sinense ZZ0214-1 TaxID=1077348 RepID=A0A2G8RY26_9APHY|nr:hypothetical protein GSI_12172 [Ganoderma sinense ZZ0214-1]